MQEKNSCVYLCSREIVSANLSIFLLRSILELIEVFERRLCAALYKDVRGNL